MPRLGRCGPTCRYSMQEHSPRHSAFSAWRAGPPALAQRSLDQQAGGTADPRGACGGRLMKAAHKFPMPTVSLDVITSALASNAIGSVAARTTDSGGGVLIGPGRHGVGARIADERGPGGGATIPETRGGGP